MRYLGSKTMLLAQIQQLVSEYQNGVFCDPFGGIGTVGSYMKSCGYQVITGDILHFAHYFQIALVEYSAIPAFDKLKRNLHISSSEALERYLTEIMAEEGWLIKEYSQNRKFFSSTNAHHIQACIDKIEFWRCSGIIDEKEYALLMASLINSMDKVANTAGTYYAYLKVYYRKALKPFKFKLINPISGLPGYSVLLDANELVKKTKCNVLYLDPPYNQRNYARYYHLPESIACGVVPDPKGKSGMFQVQDIKSKYNTRDALAAFIDLVEVADAECIVFHYTDNGMIDISKAEDILKRKGKCFEEYYFDSKGYNTTKSFVKNQHHIMKVRL
jgi:adenine-specific DNA-methyltransferase